MAENISPAMSSFRIFLLITVYTNIPTVNKYSGGDSTLRFCGILTYNK